MVKSIKVFGAALDVLDDPMKILAKHSYLNRLSNNLIDDEFDYKDPYDGFLKLSKMLAKEQFIKIGKFKIDSWLTPKPDLNDYQLINPVSFRDFVNQGGLEKYSLKLENFISKEILPDIPLMIGVDHSLSGGILRALSKKYGAKNIITIVFDAHFDGIKTDLALNLAQFARENKDILNPLYSEELEELDDNLILNDLYTYSSFLYYLINDKIIYPENLIIFGCQDYPNEKLRSVDDKRVKEYIDFYLSYENRGVKFIPVASDPTLMIKKLKKILNQIEKPYLYISFDVDIGIFKEILAARFKNIVGIEKSIILKAANTIESFMKQKNCELIGLDIVETEIYMLGKELKRANRKDKTIEVIDEFLNVFF